MDDMLHIKPAAPDLLVLDPETGQPLAADGEYKPREMYWLRRINDGDILVIEDKPAAPAKKEAKE